MLSVYALAVVLILKPTVAPRLKLMSVGKPWMDASPSPAIDHWLAGVPGLAFSQAMELGHVLAASAIIVLPGA